MAIPIDANFDDMRMECLWKETRGTKLCRCPWRTFLRISTDCGTRVVNVGVWNIWKRYLDGLWKILNEKCWERSIKNQLARLISMFLYKISRLSSSNGKLLLISSCKRTSFPIPNVVIPKSALWQWSLYFTYKSDTDEALSLVSNQYTVTQIASTVLSSRPHSCTLIRGLCRASESKLALRSNQRTGDFVPQDYENRDSILQKSPMTTGWRTTAKQTSWPAYKCVRATVCWAECRTRHLDSTAPNNYKPWRSGIWLCASPLHTTPPTPAASTCADDTARTRSSWTRFETPAQRWCKWWG